MRYLFCLFFMAAVSGCAGTSDPPLPVVHESDPVIQLVPDHLEFGQLPK